MMTRCIINKPLVICFKNNCNMLQIVSFLALAVYQISAGAVEVRPAIATARSSQYFAQNHNALAAPLIAPAPAAPLIEAVAPAPYIAPSSASVSQVIRYAPYVAAPAQYVAAAPIVQAAPLVTKPVIAPLVARTPAAIAAPQPIAPAQPVAPQQPLAPNPDAESVEIESARLRAGNQQAAQQPSFVEPQQNLARYQQEQLRGQQEQFLRIQQEQLRSQQEQVLRNQQEQLRSQQEQVLRNQQEQLRSQQEQVLRNQQEQLRPQQQQLNNQNQRAAAENAAGQSQPTGQQLSRSLAQPRQQQQLSAAPGLLSSNQYLPGAYLG